MWSTVAQGAIKRRLGKPTDTGPLELEKLDAGWNLGQNMANVVNQAKSSDSGRTPEIASMYASHGRASGSSHGKAEEEESAGGEANEEPNTRGETKKKSDPEGPSSALSVKPEQSSQIKGDRAAMAETNKNPRPERAEDESGSADTTLQGARRGPSWREREDLAAGQWRQGSKTRQPGRKGLNRNLQAETAGKWAEFLKTDQTGPQQNLGSPLYQSEQRGEDAQGGGWGLASNSALAATRFKAHRRLGGGSGGDLSGSGGANCGLGTAQAPFGGANGGASPRRVDTGGGGW